MSMSSSGDLPTFQPATESATNVLGDRHYENCDWSGGKPALSSGKPASQSTIVSNQKTVERVHKSYTLAEVLEGLAKSEEDRRESYTLAEVLEGLAKSEEDRRAKPEEIDRTGSGSDSLTAALLRVGKGVLGIGKALCAIPCAIALTLVILASRMGNDAGKGISDCLRMVLPKTVPIFSRESSETTLGKLTYIPRTVIGTLLTIPRVIIAGVGLGAAGLIYLGGGKDFAGIIAEEIKQSLEDVTNFWKMRVEDSAQTDSESSAAGVGSLNNSKEGGGTDPSALGSSSTGQSAAAPNRSSDAVMSSVQQGSEGRQGDVARANSQMGVLSESGSLRRSLKEELLSPIERQGGAASSSTQIGSAAVAALGGNESNRSSSSVVSSITQGSEGQQGGFASPNAQKGADAEARGSKSSSEESSPPKSVGSEVSARSTVSTKSVVSIPELEKRIETLEGHKFFLMQEMKNMYGYPNDLEGHINSLLAEIKQRELQVKNPGDFSNIKKSRENTAENIKTYERIIRTSLLGENGEKFGMTFDTYKKTSDEIEKIQNQIKGLERSAI